MATPSTQSLDGIKDEKDRQAPVPVAEQEISSQQIAPSSNGDIDAPGDPQFSPDWRFFTAFIAISVISLMAALDATSLSVALPIMARVLGGSAIEAFWSGTSFLLTSTVFQPILGSFSHIFGRKPMVFVSLAFFGVGAIVAAVANNFTVILVGRTIQGIGGGGVIVLAEIILTDMVPLRERGKWLSAINGMWSIGTVAGPLLGGGFSQNVTWRWIFWINLPFIGIGGVMIALFLNLHYPISSLWTKFKRVDWVGMGLFLGSFTGFLIPITWGGVQYPWDSWRTLVPLIISACGIVVFIIHQEKFAAEPLIRTSVVKNLTASLTFFQTAIHGVLLWSILYYLPLYYEAVKGFGPILAGIALFPQTFTVAPAAIVVGITISITGRYRWSTWAGWFLLTLGMGLLILLESDSTVPQWIFINLISGLGAGFLFPSLAITVQACSTNADQAHATAMFSFVRSLGQTFGVAIGGVVFQNQMRKKLLTYPLLADRASVYSRDAAGLVQIIKALPPGDMKHQLRVSYTYSLRYVWIVMTVLSALALFSTIFIKGYKLDRALETEHGYKAKEKTTDGEEEPKIAS